MTRTPLIALAVAALGATTLAAAPLAAGAAETTSTAGTAKADQASVAEMSAQWLAKDQGLSLDTARERVARQDALGAVSTTLEKSLGAKAAGSFIDQKSGALVVNVQDAASAAAVKAQGATPRTVAFSGAQLESSRSAAKQALGSDAVSSYVDPVTNRAVVTVADADMASATRALAGIEGVTLKTTSARVTTQADIQGGEQIEFSGYVCSLGFNATKDGAPVFVTAGHCAEGYSTFAHNGTFLGDTEDYSFPGNDYAYASMSGNFTGVGSVSTYPGSQAVTGSSDAPVGTAICKSGRTTDWTCGSIVARDVSVDYSNGDGTFTSVSGLVESDTCTEGGDSGGSWISGSLAQGVTSGGAGYGANAVCGEKVGQPNIAYYQPVNEILDAYGLDLTIS